MSEREDLDGLTVVNDELTLVLAGHVVTIKMSADDMRAMAIHLALAADRLEGVESPPEAKFFGNDFAGHA